MTTTLHTQFGPVPTGSTRPFIAVVRTTEGMKLGHQHVPAGTRVHARAETEATLAARLRREGFHPEGGLWIIRARSPRPGTPGPVVAEAEIVAA